MSSSVRICNVTKKFGDMKAVSKANIDIREGEFFTLLGPSGCGKTTILRMIAGFYKQNEGEIYFGEQLMNNIPPHKRNIGMVFQNYAIFPHMTVGDNVAYGLKARSIPKSEIEKRVFDALKIVELEQLKNRQPSNMSGGQQQRVALARAIVIEPGILLMDEPLSNLDAKLRLKMRNDIKQLQKRLGITTIYVTHDQQEALAVSDRIAVINKGIIQQIGTPQEIYMKPSNKFIANFIGTTNFIEGKIRKENNDFILSLPGKERKISLTKDYEGKIYYSIRPEGITITEDDGEDVIEGTIINSVFLGDCITYFAKLQNKQTIEIHKYYFNIGEIKSTGDKVNLKVSLDKTIIFDDSGKEVLG
ncbi:ABC transporter ATP-binding protein [Clostridium ganghwense]|uniref:Spermidine/putrescine import ATP-binding protein PotA n=1 Tax=Clostridium ganghwense TaxID=312089 RepID=A0ABT4CQN5_9CLOT|nr:ABC transporter ATP-binding protein [Clostridium ganghwense]MCY6371362.1 ABC transporter ATP-binding protein [Clostridium ganghwense]